jgi:hypothetical protein
MNPSGCRARIAGVLLTANRPQLALEQIRRTSALFHHLIVADGGDGSGRLSAPKVQHESRATTTTYYATPSWTSRITQAAGWVQSGAVTFMSDDDILNPGQLRWHADSLLARPEAQLAGGPWITMDRSEAPVNGGRARSLHLEQMEAPWVYRPWLFYGIFRAEAFRFVCEEIVPLSDRLAEMLALKSSLSRRRLIELTMVLGGQLLGPTLVGPVGIWGRSRARSWRERFSLWESHLELEEKIASAPAGLMSTWSEEVRSAISHDFGEGIGSAEVPSELLASWARSSIEQDRYPTWSVPLLRKAGELGRAQRQMHHRA